MLVNDDVGLDVFTLEARLDEVDLSLYGGQIVLRAALEEKRLPMAEEVGIY